PGPRLSQHCGRRVTRDERKDRRDRRGIYSLRSLRALRSSVSRGQMAGEKRHAAFSPERMLARKDFLLDPIGGLKHAVDLAHLLEALDAGGDREDVVLLA